MFFVRKILYNIVYIYISAAAENVKTCPSRDGCRQYGHKILGRTVIPIKFQSANST